MCLLYSLKLTCIFDVLLYQTNCSALLNLYTFVDTQSLSDRKQNLWPVLNSLSGLYLDEFSLSRVCLIWNQTRTQLFCKGTQV